MTDAPSRPQLETSDLLLAAGVSKPVFDCRWPETRRIAERLWSALPMGLAEVLYDKPYRGGQDRLHEAFLDAWLAWGKDVVTLDISRVPHRYATAGSSEGIRECIAQLSIDARRTGHEPVLHVFEGEYEGYGAYADAYGVRMVRHRRDRWRESFSRKDRDTLRGNLVILSQPSAIDGNIWPHYDAFIAQLERELPDLRVAVDLTYVGTVARSYHIDVSSPNIDTIFFSLSKVFGVYYHRIGGVLSRSPMPGLVGNKWFKNTFSLQLGRELLALHPPRTIPATYAAVQARAAVDAGNAIGVPLTPSDVILIAHRPWGDAMPPALGALRRGDAVRACLTPGLDRQIFGVGGTAARVERA